METGPAPLSECVRTSRQEVLRATPRHSSVQERDRFAWLQASEPSRPVSAAPGAHTGDGHERYVESTYRWVGLRDLQADHRIPESQRRQAFRGLDRSRVADRRTRRRAISRLLSTGRCRSVEILWLRMAAWQRSRERTVLR